METAYVFVKIDQIQKGVITSADRGVFEEVRIFTTENGDTVIRIKHSDNSYFRSWVTRVNGQQIGGLNKARTFIESVTGDTKDRLADAFKMCHFLMYAVANIYEKSTSTLKNGLEDDIKEALDAFITIRDANPELFNLDLKSSKANALSTIIAREKDVKDILKASTEEQEIG